MVMTFRLLFLNFVVENLKLLVVGIDAMSEIKSDKKKMCSVSKALENVKCLKFQFFNNYCIMVSENPTLKMVISIIGSNITAYFTALFLQILMIIESSIEIR